MTTESKETVDENTKRGASKREFIKTLAGLGLGAAMAQTLYSSLNPKQRAQLVAWAQSYGKPMTYAELGRLIDAAAWDDVVRAVRYQPASYIIYQAPDGSYQAKNGNTGQIEFSGTDAASVIQNAINNMITGKVLLIGLFTLNRTVNVKEDIVIEGLGKNITVINTPPNAPAFLYTQPATGSVVFRPLILRNLTLKLPTTGGPHYGVKVDCSAYGGARAMIRNVQIDGWNASGAYDKNSATPHIGINLIKVWDFLLRNLEITMPGVCIRMTNYGTIYDTYLDGGANGKAIGILLDAYGASIKAINLITERGARPVFKSTQASLYLNCYNFAAEGAGFDVTPPEPIIELSYSSGTWDVGIGFNGATIGAVAISINKVYGSSIRWFHPSNDITEKVWMPWAYSVTSGTPTVSFNNGRIVINNSGQTTNAVVDIPLYRLAYLEFGYGGYITGVGEAQLIDPAASTRIEAIGIGTSGNLYLRMADSAVPYNETQIIDTSAVGEYDILGFIGVTANVKNIVYGAGGVYKSMKAVFSQALGFMAPSVLRLNVPAGQSLQFRPRFYS